jgi:tetratricopeptide (TPR) repeat protein
VASESRTVCFGQVLMSVDTYAICPCGSGKKIKFCKCKDSVGELDRVLKMVEGGQVVPALDRLATILQEHPDAAWALAIRGRLLLDLREYGSLDENADRFIRLQPSNPLALTQRAAAQLFQGKVDEATESILEALTESGRNVDSFVLDVASVLAYSLAQQGVFMTARVYATLAMTASGYEGGQTAVSVLRQMNSAPVISQLLKSNPTEIRRPSDVDWGERYDEAAALLQNNKVVLAQSKFESLRRSIPDEPAVLSGLLTCAIWRGDTDAQSQLLAKLSACESLDFEERVRYRARAALVNPATPELSVEVIKFSAEIDKVDEIEMALAADSRYVALPADMLAGMRASEDDIAPRSGFQILDRDKPESLETLPPVDQVPEAIAVVFIYGKQTDREARIEVQDVRRENADDVRGRITAAIGDTQLNEDSGSSLPLLVACQPPVAMIRFQAKPAEAEKLQAELTTARMPRAIVSAPLPILGGKSLSDLTGDDSKLLERTAVMRIIDQYDSVASKGEGLIAQVYELAGLEPPPPIKPTDAEIETLAGEDLNRVDPTGLNPESLVYLLQRAQQISATLAVRRFAKRLIETDLDEQQQPMKMLAYVTLVNASERTEDALATLEQAKAFAELHNLSSANLLLSEVGLRLSAGDGQGFQKAVETLSTRHGNEPEIMAQLQQLLMAYGLIGPDGAPRARPGAPAPAGAQPASSGLWNPDGGSAPPAEPAADGGGGGKLWIPGMD